MRRRAFLSLLAPPVTDQQDLFTARTGGYALYRIPGLLVTPRGHLIAYCEARKSESGDWGATDVLLRRSTDRGRSWSNPRVVAFVPGDHLKNPVALEHKIGTPGQVLYNNPVAIADQRTRTVHFLFCIENMRAFHMSSRDDGATFSAPVEITSAFDEFRAEYSWRVFAIGPGHGIQLRSGRLLASVWLSVGTGGHGHRPSVAATIFSDDNGATWRRGDIIVRHSDDTPNPSEAALVELSDGRVHINVRTESRRRRRTVAISPDGATRWSAPAFDEALTDPICFASLTKTRKGEILFVNPDDPDKRRNLAVRLSRDDARTWPLKRTLDPGVAAYADIAAHPEGPIFCLYERGGLDNNAFRTAALTLARFPVEWLTAAPGTKGE
jgi:sialidase-1